MKRLRWVGPLVVAVLFGAVAASMLLRPGPVLSERQLLDAYARGIRLGQTRFADPQVEDVDRPPPVDCADRLWSTMAEDGTFISAASPESRMINTVLLTDRGEAKRRFDAIRASVEGCAMPGSIYERFDEATSGAPRWVAYRTSYDGAPTGESLLWQYGNVVVVVVLEPGLTARTADRELKLAIDQA